MYQGTIADPAAVKLYSSGYTDAADLANWLNVTIEEGAGGSFGPGPGLSSRTRLRLAVT